MTSSVDVANCARNASGTTKVAVNIVHTYVGDLVIDLVAPDGTSYRLKGSSNDSSDNINTTYTVNAAAEAANGAWKLKVQDVPGRHRLHQQLVADRLIHTWST